MTSLKTSIKTITYLSDIGCLEIQGASLLDDDLVVNLCTSEHLLVHHPMLEGILLSECER
ncbi:TPA: hypothetical protein N2X62_005038, partial [Escherichia coli]|nr:hypothetical protein [Escherichia coli]